MNSILLISLLGAGAYFYVRNLQKQNEASNELKYEYINTQVNRANTSLQNLSLIINFYIINDTQTDLKFDSYTGKIKSGIKTLTTYSITPPQTNNQIPSDSKTKFSAIVNISTSHAGAFLLNILKKLIQRKPVQINLINEGVLVVSGFKIKYVDKINQNINFFNTNDDGKPEDSGASQKNRGQKGQRHTPPSGGGQV